MVEERENLVVDIEGNLKVLNDQMWVLLESLETIDSFLTGVSTRVRDAEEQYSKLQRETPEAFSEVQGWLGRVYDRVESTLDIVGSANKITSSLVAMGLREVEE